ncbi:MAG: hypothetical protein QOH05_773, partial [Acetobacteraceae bacterium]|nr:hypothetical protein [Acetobacteraceae bacterium]
MISLGTAMALVRGLHLAATLSLLGTAGFVAWMLPAAGIVPDLARRGLIRLWWISGLVALMAGLGWFTVQSAMIAGAGSWSDLAAALPVVAGHTRFGNILMVRLGLLVAATALAVVRSSVPGPTQGRSSVPGPAQGRSLAPGSAQGRPPGVTVAARAGRGALARPDTPGDGQTAGPSGDERAPSGRDERGQPDRLTLYLALVLSIAAVGLQGLIGHAGATEGAIGDGLVLSELLHLLAAGIWLGALLPLWLSTSALAPAQAVAVCERFSPIGLACVLVLAGTGFAQGVQLIGGLPALFGTRYGHIALLKIALFLLALGLAAVNRLWLTDRLAAGAAGARRHLRVSVSIETVVGLAIVGAAAFMASSPPAAHTTPVWPFSWRFSLTTVNEDADFRREVTISLVVIGAAIALMGAA